MDIKLVIDFELDLYLMYRIKFNVIQSELLQKNYKIIKNFVKTSHKMLLQKWNTANNKVFFFFNFTLHF